MVMGSPKANVCYGRSGLLHLGFRALDAFRARKGALPQPGSPADAAELVKIASEINAASELKVEELGEPDSRLAPRVPRPLPAAPLLRSPPPRSPLPAPPLFRCPHPRSFAARTPTQQPPPDLARSSHAPPTHPRAAAQRSRRGARC